MPKSNVVLLLLWLVGCASIQGYHYSNEPQVKFGKASQKDLIVTVEPSCDIYQGGHFSSFSFRIENYLAKSIHISRQNLQLKTDDRAAFAPTSLRVEHLRRKFVAPQIISQKNTEIGSVEIGPNEAAILRAYFDPQGKPLRMEFSADIVDSKNELLVQAKNICNDPTPAYGK